MMETPKSNMVYHQASYKRDVFVPKTFTASFGTHLESKQCCIASRTVWSAKSATGFCHHIVQFRSLKR